MKTLTHLDVLVVYTSSVARSASVDDEQSRTPFLTDSKQSNYNLSYAYFLSRCNKAGLKAGFTTSEDIRGPGTCKCYWIIKADKWVKVRQSAEANHIFDKISPTTIIRAAERELLFSNDSITPFNDSELFSTFFDKFKTYKQLSEYAIPTTSVKSGSLGDITAAIARLETRLQNHLHRNDFSQELVLKDRFGAGGNFVYKIRGKHALEIGLIMAENPSIQFVLQPFLNFNKGYTYKNCKTATDIRLIYQHNKLLQCYIRMAKAKDFRCNEHQGGQLEYVKDGDIPDQVHRISQNIVKKINKPSTLFALDFVMSNTGRAYFIEGNIGPGIDWDVTKKINETKSKQLIQSIVDELASRVRANLVFNAFPTKVVTTIPLLN